MAEDRTGSDEKQKVRFFKYVLHCDVPLRETQGWRRLPALDGTHHGIYATLMEIPE